ncbi:MAG: PepSY domain-containing protein [Undibacterium sp.]|nr:PepSY domain-containing protein [Opitutaceae bacterium]
MTFRKTIFWGHLAAGLLAGLAIGIMCFTGTILAFEKPLVAWSERDARQITLPAPGTPRLTFAEMQAKLPAAQPAARPQNIVLQNDPRAAVAFTTGRSGGFYVNPYTGEVRQPQSAAMGEFMHTMTDLHRSLGFRGQESRTRGQLINGICNLAFFVLAVTGIYLWWPRKWRTKGLRRSLWFVRASGKARDWNWHNVIGLWTSPVLIVLTLTAIPISFRWGATLIYTVTGTEAPAANTGPGVAAAATPPAVTVTPPSLDAKPLPLDALIATVQKQTPDWQTLTLRTGNAGSAGAARPAAAAPAEGVAPSPGRTIENRVTERGDSSASKIGNPITAVTLTVRESTSWPRTANTTLTVNPYTGEILKRTGYADLNAAQRLRAWTRFLHTGEALGWPGQLAAGLACLGALVLVYTGFALSWRRFFGRRPQPETAAPARA